MNLLFPSLPSVLVCLHTTFLPYVFLVTLRPPLSLLIHTQILLPFFNLSSHNIILFFRRILVLSLSLSYRPVIRLPLYSCHCLISLCIITNNLFLLCLFPFLRLSTLINLSTQHPFLSLAALPPLLGSHNIHIPASAHHSPPFSLTVLGFHYSPERKDFKTDSEACGRAASCTTFSAEGESLSGQAGAALLPELQQWAANQAPHTYLRHHKLQFLDRTQ